MSVSSAVTHSRWDLISLGEVMLRLDPAEGRIATTRTFQVWEGGGEYNVARSLRRCFGWRTAVATALADNPVGRLVEDLILQGGVDPSLILWRAFDGVGRELRNGLNFVERGFGARAPLGCSDRGHTAVSQLQPADFDWEAMFAGGVRCLHTGGIFAALSGSTPLVAQQAMQAARRHGALVSYDFNYRDSLWRDHGGNAKAAEVNTALVQLADVLFAGEEDFALRLNVDLSGLPSFANAASPGDRHELILRRVAAAYPNLQAIAMTHRLAEGAGRHQWGACALVHGQFVAQPQRPIDVLDRIGAGDSFAAGFLYGLLEQRGAPWALACGIAHSTLAVTTPGDSSMATLAEVERLITGDAMRTHR